MATGRIPINGTAAIQQTLIDAKGDLIAGTGADAVARLAVGANGTTLVADSSEATGLKWATPAAGGKVLQVVQATTSTPANLSTTSFTDTNITATITPTSATSKVLVMVSGSIRCLRTIEPTVVNKARLVRGASAVHTRDNVLFLEARLSTANSRLDMVVPFTFNYLDDPATTSATTYKIQGAQVSASGNLDFQFDNSPTTIILMEIGA